MHHGIVIVDLVQGVFIPWERGGRVVTFVVPKVPLPKKNTKCVSTHEKKSWKLGNPQVDISGC